ncbi:tetratricopeptide repeat protein [Pelotomaculum isophthalicicum JI]|uniref:Tetratricopeptide repeat protein n=1 Tax=Pelotomaculum isophthalicicum JI TaxID=947010 RepID=A0A9X4H931_9FIRM|nr:tetratricopeptide repeat protein [Pelotomaculum isophthalicicum]MDF9409604.1 tetratricopeptide repeat protein [Pelotomaculum isophthalicicum JI]
MRKKEFYFVLLLFTIIITANWLVRKDARLIAISILFVILYVLFYGTEIVTAYYLYLADRSFKKCDDSKAVNYYWKVHQIAPGKITRTASLAIIKNIEGKWDEAEKLYREVLRLRPNDIRLQYNLAVTLINKGCYDEARTILILLTHLYPRLYYHHATLGEVLMRQGRYEEAYRHLSMALRINSSETNIRNKLEAVVSKLKDER